MKTYKELEIEVLKSDSSIPASKTKYEIMKIQSFIKLKKHRPEYDYSETEYIGIKTEIKVRCKEHGEFKIVPKNLLRGGGCSKCKTNTELEKLQKDFIKKANSKYPQYDYSKVQYKNYKTKVEIICKEHGSFKVGVSSFLKNGKCPKCFLQESKDRYSKPLKTFLEDVEKIHPQYDYSKVDYKNCRTKVEIICKEHGSFFSIPSSLLQGCGCPECGKIKSFKAQGLDKDIYLERVYKKHGNKIKVFEDTYVNKKSSIKIECPNHGILEINANQLIKSEYGCPKCGKDMISTNKTTSFETLEKLVSDKFQDKISVKESSYSNYSEEIEGVCKTHGEFTSKPYLILKSKQGCPICNTELKGVKRRTTLEGFKRKLHKKFGNLFELVGGSYKGFRVEATFVCKTHGTFNLKPKDIISSVCGCPKCADESRLTKQTMPYSYFLEKSREKFGDKFIYLEDTYIRGSSKMRAICKIHGEISIIPNNHFNQMYGCKKCAIENSPSYKPYLDKPTTLYYIKILKEDKEYYKLGITTTKISQRFKSANVDNFTYQIIATKTFPTGSSAYYLEQYLLHQHSSNQIDFILLPKSGGNSEIFNQDIYESIKQYFD